MQSNFKINSRKKEKRIKDMENLLKSKSQNNISNVIPPQQFKNNLKNFQEHPEISKDTLSLLLKSKFEEVMQLKEQLEKEKKMLTEKLELYEGNCKINLNQLMMRMF